MLEKIKSLLPFIIIVILGIIGIIGYMVDDSGSPVRVLFRTKGGNVIFTHKAHIEDYGSECGSCHHEVEGDEKDCRKCHSSGTDYDLLCEGRPIHKQCIGANCIDCHKENGRDEKDCGFCHK